MNGHPRDQAKVSVHCRWPLVTGTDGQAGAPNIIGLHIATIHPTITTSDIPNEYPSKHYTSGPIPVSYWLIKFIEATVLAFTCQYAIFIDWSITNLPVHADTGPMQACNVTVLTYKGIIKHISAASSVDYGTNYSSTCHERTPSGPGKSVRTLQVAARHRDGRAGGGRQI